MTATGAMVAELLERNRRRMTETGTMVAELFARNRHREPEDEAPPHGGALHQQQRDRWAPSHWRAGPCQCQAHAEVIPNPVYAQARQFASPAGGGSPRAAPEICTICYEEQAPEHSFRLSCGHAWHRECLQRYVESNTEAGQVPVKCVYCGLPLKDGEIQELAGPAAFAKYQRFARNAEVETDPTLRWCPTPGCETVLRREAGGSRVTPAPALSATTALMVAAGLAAWAARGLGLSWELQAASSLLALALALGRAHARGCHGDSDSRQGFGVQCPSCEQASCFDCGSAWHAGQSCEEVAEQELASWAAGRNVGRCPRCRSMIEKNLGCNHMTCRACKCQFCWLCSREWSHSHVCIGFSTSHCEGMLGQLCNRIPGPSWVVGYLFLSASLWLARLLGYGGVAADPLPALDSTVEVLGFATLGVAGCGLGCAAAGARLCRSGWQARRAGAWALAAGCCAALAVAFRVRSWLGPFGPEWLGLLWLGNVLVVAQAWALARRPCPTHAFPPLRNSLPLHSRFGVARWHVLGVAPWVLAPLLLVLALQVAVHGWPVPGAAADAQVAPTAGAAGAADGSAWASLPAQGSEVAALPPPRSSGSAPAPGPGLVQPELRRSAADLSRALGAARAACSGCQGNAALDAALGEVDKATEAFAGKVAAEMADLQARMQHLELQIAAGDSHQGIGFGGWMRWLSSRLAGSLLVLLVLAALLAHATSAFLVMFTEEEIESYHSRIWQRALAVSRSLLLCLLVAALSADSAWPSAGACAWWGARLFLPCFFAFMLWEVGDQLIRLPVMLSLVPALGLRALAAAGWPVDLLLLVWGGAMSCALAARGPSSQLGELLGRVPFLAPRGVGAFCGVVLWALGQVVNVHALVGVALASSAPLAVEAAFAAWAPLVLAGAPAKQRAAAAPPVPAASA
uniref:RBR-type E3 ubiquitin transferase n=1 Tax=Alexandrium monilatum TaxID=311494 RepID=A0A7S4WAG2_9DINO